MEPPQTQPPHPDPRISGLPEPARRHLAAARVSAEIAPAGPAPQPAPGGRWGGGQVGSPLLVPCRVSVSLCVFACRGLGRTRAVRYRALSPSPPRPPPCAGQGQPIPAAAVPLPRPGVTAPGADWRLRPRGRPRRAPGPPVAAVPRRVQGAVPPGKGGGRCAAAPTRSRGPADGQGEASEWASRGSWGG